MAKEPDATEQQIFFGDMPMHELFQKQVQQVMEQVDLDEDCQAGASGGAELPVLRHRRDELHREVNRKKKPAAAGIISDHRHRLDLDLEAVVQLRHRHDAAGRPRGARPFRIERVERRP